MPVSLPSKKQINQLAQRFGGRVSSVNKNGSFQVRFGGPSRAAERYVITFKDFTAARKFKLFLESKGLQSVSHHTRTTKDVELFVPKGEDAFATPARRSLNKVL